MFSTYFSYLGSRRHNNISVSRTLESSIFPPSFPFFFLSLFEPTNKLCTFWIIPDVFAEWYLETIKHVTLLFLCNLSPETVVLQWHAISFKNPPFRVDSTTVVLRFLSVREGSSRGLPTESRNTPVIEKVPLLVFSYKTMLYGAKLW